MAGVGGLSDAALDAAFAASFDKGDVFAIQYYGAEIIDRLTSVWSFVAGAFGAQRFPLYEARARFSQSGAARGSLGDSAADVSKGIAAAGMPVAGVVAVIGLIAVVVLIATRR